MFLLINVYTYYTLKRRSTQGQTKHQKVIRGEEIIAKFSRDAVYWNSSRDLFLISGDVELELALDLDGDFRLEADAAVPVWPCWASEVLASSSKPLSAPAATRAR